MDICPILVAVFATSGLILAITYGLAERHVTQLQGELKELRSQSKSIPPTLSGGM